MTLTYISTKLNNNLLNSVTENSFDNTERRKKRDLINVTIKLLFWSSSVIYIVIKSGLHYNNEGPYPYYGRTVCGETADKFYEISLHC